MKIRYRHYHLCPNKKMRWCVFSPLGSHATQYFLRECGAHQAPPYLCRSKQAARTLDAWLYRLDVLKFLWIVRINRILLRNLSFFKRKRSNSCWFTMESVVKVVKRPPIDESEDGELTDDDPQTVRSNEIEEDKPRKRQRDSDDAEESR